MSFTEFLSRVQKALKDTLQRATSPSDTADQASGDNFVQHLPTTITGLYVEQYKKKYHLVKQQQHSELVFKMRV